MWGPARDVRDNQPLMAGYHPAALIDTGVRQVQPGNWLPEGSRRRYMFIGEVGVDPRLGDGRGYRRRVASYAAGRAWVEHGQVIFKAEVGSQSPGRRADPGVWVHRSGAVSVWARLVPATLAAVIVGGGRIASLYVNSQHGGRPPLSGL